MVYLAPIRGDRGEWAIAKLTELGITTVVPLLCEHLALKFSGDAREKLLSRWRKIAAEASGQCRRSYDLVVADPVAVANVPLTVAVATPGASGTLASTSAIAIGPEGGWSDSEWPADQPRIGLGSTVLRTETAALVAGTLLKFGVAQWPRLSSE
jgi:16S rRNA (uracil1498-N3)-methyltransferase